MAETFETAARRKTSWPELWKTLKQLHSLVSGEELHGATVESQQGRVVSLPNQFVALLVQAGLRTGHTHKAKGKGRSAPRTRSELSYHSLRHTAVSLLKNAGVPHAIAQALVGHESQEIGQLYRHYAFALFKEPPPTALEQSL